MLKFSRKNAIIKKVHKIMEGYGLKKTVKSRMTFSLFLIMMVVFILAAYIFYGTLSANIRNDRYSVLDSAAIFASIEINGDSARRYITSRKTDDEYDVVLEKLKRYVHDNRIERISMISYGNTVGYYIYDTDDKKIGTKVSYDDYTSAMKEKLVECHEKWHFAKGKKQYAYFPVRTADNKAVGYIIIEDNITIKNLPLILLSDAAVSALLIFAACFISVHFLKKMIFDPIELFANAASEFTGSETENGDELRSKFETGRNDEIGRLGQSIISMLDVIRNSNENLSSAVYDATHDGMTKTFNKRHYENKLNSFRSCSSICVIYFDVNNLKLINDTLGHERGDYVIKRAADYIREIAFDDSFCFRMGGDEFLLVVPDHSYKEIYSLIDRIESDCPVILSADTDSVKCTVAYGYAYDKAPYSYEKLLAEAEENMYRKKYEIKKQLNMPER